jgi:hypothetical protein
MAHPLRGFLMTLIRVVPAVLLGLWGMALIAAPVLIPDSVRVPDDDPGLGRLVVAEPGYLYEVWWNDNVDQGDFDFNDLVIEVRFAESLIDGFVPAEAKIKGSNTAHNLVSYTPSGTEIGSSWAAFATPIGQEAKFSLADKTDADVWFTGNRERNSDNQYHAWVSVAGGEPRDTRDTTSAPEPHTLFLLSSGAGLILLFARKRTDRTVVN